MATPNFKIQVEQFLRRIGQGNVVITFDVGNNPVFTPEIKKVTVDQIYDYYQLSGQALFDSIERYSKGLSNKMFPNLYKFAKDKTLTSGAYLPSESIQRIVEPVTVYDHVSGEDPIPAYLIPENIIELCRNSVGIRKLSRQYPGYYIRNGSIHVLPDSMTKISFNYVNSIDRIQLTNGSAYDDIWPTNEGRLLVDGMVMLSQGDSGNTNLEQFYFNKISNLYKMKSLPITNNNNSLNEQL
jgi:hypothetical protein